MRENPLVKQRTQFGKIWDETHLLDLSLQLGGNDTFRDLLEELALRAGQVRAELGLPAGDLVDRNGVEETVDTGEDDRYLDLGREGLVLALLCSPPDARQSINSRKSGEAIGRTQELGETGTTGEEEACRGIEIGTELGKGGDFAILGEVELERPGKLLHDLAEKCR